MPPSADDSTFFSSMLLPSPPSGMGQKADRYYGKNVRSLSFNGQLHAMPAIPEDNEVSPVQMSGEQKVMDLLFFALDGNFYETVSSDGSDSPDDGFYKPSDPLKGPEMKDGEKKHEKAKESQEDLVDMSGIDADSKTKLSVTHDGWGLHFLRNKGCKIYHMPEDESLAAGKATKSVNVDLESGQVQSKPSHPILAVESGGLPASSTANFFGFQQTLYKSVVVMVFFLINLEIAGIIVVTGLFVGGTAPATSVIGGAGSVLFGIMLLNLFVSRFRRMILQKYLQVTRKTSLSDLEKLPRGRSVVVRGKVSALESKLVSSDLQNVEGCLLVETSLQSLQPKGRHSFKSKQHVEQTRAVSFRITDEETGAWALVDAGLASEMGLMVPMLRMATAVPVTGNQNLGKWLGTYQETVMEAIGDNTQLTLYEGYVCEGDVVTVMGLLNKTANNGLPVIEPLTKPKNVSKFLFLWKVLPYFYPTWISGLVISNEF